MKSRHLLMPAVGLAVCALLVSGCGKGGGGSSGGSTSAKSSPSGSSTTPPAEEPNGGGSAGGGGRTIAASPPAPNLGYAYHSAALAYYYFYHKKTTVVWGDVGAEWGHYDQDDYSTTLDNGYGLAWPTFSNATLFGSYYDIYTAPPPPPASAPYHDPFPDSSTTPLGTIEGGFTYWDIQADALTCYADLGSTVTYPTTASYTGTGPDAHTYTCRYHGVSEGHYVYDLAGKTFTTGTYNFSSDVRLKGTPTAVGELTISGSATDVFVFRIHGNLWVQGNTRVKFTGGAKPENVYWRVEVADTSGYYAGYDGTTGTYIYEDVPGVYIGDDKDYPPYRDPLVNGFSSFAGTILCKGDIAVGGGSSLTGRALSLDYGWWLYAVAVYGSITINATKPLSLGTALDFAVLANVDITNTGETSIKGKVGVATGAVTPKTGPDAIEVDPPSSWLADGDPASDVAITSAAAAAFDGSTRDVDYDLTGKQLLGKRLPPGVYLVDDAAWDGDAKLDGPVTLDGLNDPTSVWIFRFAGVMDVDTLTGVIQFTYKNGADPNGVYWICTKAHLGTAVSLRGTVLASSSATDAIKLESDAVLQGRAVAASGSIILNNNTVFSDSSGGLLTWTTPPVRQSNQVPSRNEEARSVANDGTYMYVFGFVGDALSATNTKWRIEKRLLSDGSLLAGFGSSGGVTWDPGTGNDIPRKIVIDGTGIYVLGSTETSSGSGVYQWRIEKRSLTDGSLMTAFDTDGIYTTALTNGGLAGDMDVSSGTLYIVGEQNDDVDPTIQRVRIEKRSATSGALDASNSAFMTPDTWYDGFAFYTSDPGIGAPTYPATPVGVIVEYTLNLLGHQGKSARCLTLVPSPATGSPFLLLGGWENLGTDIVFGWGIWGMIEKRDLATGALDKTIPSFPIWPGYGTLSSGNGTQECPIAISGDARMAVQSIVNDGVHSYQLLSADYGGYSGIAGGKHYWVLEKRRMIAYPGTAPDYTDPITGGAPEAEYYSLLEYAPVPYSPLVTDYGCNQMCVDGKRLFIVGSTIGDLGGEAWHIEKRKTSVLVLDALFNTSGVRPGVVDVDPEPGQLAIPEEWYIYDGHTYAYRWTTVNPVTDGDSLTYYVVTDFGWTPESAYHHAGVPAVPGRPDRCFAVTANGTSIYVVGSDAADTPDHAGQWRIEARNK